MASKVHAVTKLEIIVGDWEGKRKYPARLCKGCASHKSEVKLDTFVNSVLFRFTNGLVLRSTIQ
jgi:hypothetical protein